VGQLQAIGLHYRLTRRGLNPSLLLQFDEPQDDIAVALARPAHGREDGRGGPRLDANEVLATPNAARASAGRAWDFSGAAPRIRRPPRGRRGRM
jgi:hypothetical protein